MQERAAVRYRLTKGEEKEKKNQKEAHHHASGLSRSDLSQIQRADNGESPSSYATDNTGEDEKAKDTR